MVDRCKNKIEKKDWGSKNSIKSVFETLDKNDSFLKCFLNFAE